MQVGGEVSRRCNVQEEGLSLAPIGAGLAADAKGRSEAVDTSSRAAMGYRRRVDGQQQAMRKQSRVAVK